MKTNTPKAVEQWQVELDKVGFVRKLFMARKWYGGDWWFIAHQRVILLFVIIVGIFPQWFAPYDPTAEVGPSFLAPGEPPPGYELIVLETNGIQTIGDITNPEQIAAKTEFHWVSGGKSIQPGNPRSGGKDKPDSSRIQYLSIPSETI